jgi:aspartyl-tRNA(Asn)/glutamyl-tRNA(Gln) amidotransferase subunit B
MTARGVLSEVFKSGEKPSVAAQRLGFDLPAAGTSELEQWCRESIAANPRSLADFNAGKESAINGFKGHVMKAARGRVTPQAMDEMLRRILNDS